MDGRQIFRKIVIQNPKYSAWWRCGQLPVRMVQQPLVAFWYPITHVHGLGRMDCREDMPRMLPPIVGIQPKRNHLTICYYRLQVGSLRLCDPMSQPVMEFYWRQPESNGRLPGHG